MYQPTSHRKFDQRLLDNLLGTAYTFDLSAPGGSFMPDSRQVMELFEPMLQIDFPGLWIYCTLVVLEPSAQIVRHQDVWSGAAIRYHIPLQLNEQCWVYSEWNHAVWQQLAVGQVYTMNPGLPHGAVNWGTTRRIHLLIDVAQA